MTESRSPFAASPDAKDARRAEGNASPAVSAGHSFSSGPSVSAAPSFTAGPSVSAGPSFSADHGQVAGPRSSPDPIHDAGPPAPRTASASSAFVKRSSDSFSPAASGALSRSSSTTTASQFVNSSGGSVLRPPNEHRFATLHKAVDPDQLPYYYGGRRWHAGEPRDEEQGLPREPGLEKWETQRATPVKQVTAATMPAVLQQWVRRPALLKWWLLLSLVLMLGAVVYCAVLAWRILVLVLAMIVFIDGVSGAAAASIYLIRRRDTDALHFAKVVEMVHVISRVCAVMSAIALVMAIVAGSLESKQSTCDSTGFGHWAGCFSTAARVVAILAALVVLLPHVVISGLVAHRANGMSRHLLSTSVGL